MNNNTFIHKYLDSLITNKDIVVDATVGNGNDTLLLCSKAKKVYGFDIQEEAIKRTREKTKDFNNVILINDNHSNVDKYIKEKINLAIFNLGYLPNSDSKIITKKEDTLLSFKKIYSLLKENGYLIITFYIGHIGGKDEYYFIDQYIKNTNIKIIEKYKENRKILEPITYIIKK